MLLVCQVGHKAPLRPPAESLRTLASCAGCPRGCPSSRLEAGRRRPEWLLVDGLQGGSGQTVDWARPAGVDVASGVAAADGLRKDPALVVAFVAAVRGPAP